MHVFITLRQHCELIFYIGGVYYTFEAKLNNSTHASSAGFSHAIDPVNGFLFRPLYTVDVECGLFEVFRAKMV